MSSDYVPSVLRQNWQVLRVENLQGQRKSYIGFPFIHATSPYTQGLLQPVECVCSWWVMSILHFTALRRRGHVRDISSVAPFCFSVLTTQIRGKAELGKGAYPKPLATRSKNWKSISEMSPRLTFFGLICHGNMILLTIFRGNWSNFFTFIALVIKPYWGFILFCILAFFPLSSCSVLNVGSSKGISKVGKIRRNLQNNWANFRIYADLDEIYS